MTPRAPCTASRFRIRAGHDGLTRLNASRPPSARSAAAVSAPSKASVLLNQCRAWPTDGCAHWHTATSSFSGESPTLENSRRHSSSRAARTAAELSLGDWTPLDAALGLDSEAGEAAGAVAAAGTATGTTRSRLLDLNLRPVLYESTALPLS